MRDGIPLHVRAKSFAVLCHLARHAGRVISKDDIFATVWGARGVSDETLTQSIRELRLLLGPAGAMCLRTLRGRGYVLELPDASEPHRVGAVRLPRLVILPLAAQNLDPNDICLIDGLSEEITHATARYGQISVIARHSAFQFRPGTASPQQSAEKLGADCYVTGSARRTGDMLMVAASLYETSTGRQLWAETFRLTADQFHDAPSVMAHRIVSRMSLAVERAIPRHPATGGSSDLLAYQHFARAVFLLRQYGDGVNETARDHLDAALRLDAEFALAHAYRGLVELILHDYGAAPPAALERAATHTTTAVTLAPEEARCHWVAGEVSLCRRQHATAELQLQRALRLNPSDPDMMAVMGYLVTMRGRPAEGVAWFERAMALNPLHPTWYHNDIGMALQMAGQPDRAISHLQISRHPDPWWYTRIASCFAAIGDLDRAARHMGLAYAIQPDWDAVAAFRQGLECEHPESVEPLLHMIQRADAAFRQRRPT